MHYMPASIAVGDKKTIGFLGKNVGAGKSQYRGKQKAVHERTGKL